MQIKGFERSFFVFIYLNPDAQNELLSLGTKGNHRDISKYLLIIVQTTLQCLLII